MSLRGALKILRPRSRHLPQHWQQPHTFNMPPTMEQAREEGNVAFKAGRLVEARALYTVALKLSASPPLTSPTNPAAPTAAVTTMINFTVPCLANRALVLLKLELFPAALADATTGLKLLAKGEQAGAMSVPGNTLAVALAAVSPVRRKLLFRRGTALRALDRLEEALDAFRLSVDADAAGTTAAASATTMVQIAETERALAAQRGSNTSGERERPADRTRPHCQLQSHRRFRSSRTTLSSSCAPRLFRGQWPAH